MTIPPPVVRRPGEPELTADGRSSNGLPLRTEAERMMFCDAYFQAVGAPTVYASDGYREYELPRDVDKELTDRPYFWMWVEKTQQPVKPTILRLAFNETALQRENERLRQAALAEQNTQAGHDAVGRPPAGWWFRPPTAELFTLGCFRLDKICKSLDVRGRFACVQVATASASSAADNPTVSQPTRWVPWLMANAMISYRCDLVEQVFVSVGCCLVNGQLIESLHRHLTHLRMTAAAPDTLLRGARMSWPQGLAMIRKRLEQIALRKPTHWAEAANRRLERELQQLHTYYRSIAPDVPETERPAVERERDRKERELVERMQPRIEISLRQLAIIGLVERPARP
ncbi:MAG: hypothetical protein IRZ33_10565 [Alicyclobacillaceae bacterium]|nr:hypothetical protein [Alicyclobacillaceae bacterium]